MISGTGLPSIPATLAARLKRVLDVVEDMDPNEAGDLLAEAFAKHVKHHFNIPGPTADYAYVELTLEDKTLGVMPCRVTVFRETPPVNRTASLAHTVASPAPAESERKEMVDG